MKTRVWGAGLILAWIFLIGLQSFLAKAQGTAFTYQGRLNDGGMLANGRYDFRFAIYDANTNGNLASGFITNSAVAVSNGLFTVALDFGSGVLTGSNRWLEVAVETNGGTSFTVLVPRQQITPTPYAILAETAASLPGLLVQQETNGTSDLTVGGNFSANTINLGANLDLPDPATIYSGGNTLLHSDGIYHNLFGGLLAGNAGGENGAGNTAYGYASLSANTTGQGNTAAGGYALSGNTGGSFNSAVGYSALQANTGGSDNTAVGVSALGNLNNGSGNIALGYNAGQLLYNGANNIYIGNRGVDGDHNVIRLGDPTVHTQVYVAGVIHGDGSGLTNLGAALPANVALLDTSQTFTGTNVFKLTADAARGLLVTDGTTNGNIAIQPLTGANSGFAAINFNGYFANGEQQFKSTKARWRIFTDQRGASDNLKIDSYLPGLGGTTEMTFSTNGNVNIGNASIGNVSIGTISGDTRITGLLRSGSETGTSEPPSPGGLVIRRINSTTTATGSVVAVVSLLNSPGLVALVRDGTSGGFQIQYPAAKSGFGDLLTIAATGIDSNGAQHNFYQNITISPASGGVLQLFTDTQNIVHFECSFGEPAFSYQMTQVTLTRFWSNSSPFSNDWVGTVISTVNQ